MLGVYVAGDSGGYLNPAITFANCLYRGLPWKRFPIYLVAQFLGGWIAAGIVYGYYYYAIDNYEGVGVRTVPPSKGATAGIFCTYPQSFMTTNAQFWAEVIETTILQFGIFALKDMSNVGAERFLPLGLFFLIFGLGACFGFETGYAMNFARDFGPRLMSYMVGYGPKVWTAGHYYFWVPIVAPFIGCTFGGFLYDVFIYTGPSPINTPWLGLKRFIRPDKAKEIDDKYGVREGEVA
jgi:aquaglyceroporin related protein